MATRIFKPHAYQTLALSFIADTPRCALWAGMGLGKTAIVLGFLDTLHNVWGEDAPTLVLAPKRVAITTWPEEARKWAHLSGLSVVSVTGTAAERAAALLGDAQVYCTNYDNLVWLRDHYRHAGRAWPFRTVVADESTRLKSFRVKQGGVRAQALAQFAHTEVERWINLTGTPAPNGLVDLWGQTWFLDAGVRLGRSFSSFESRWFATKRRPGQAFGGEQFILPGAQDEIHERLADICLTLDPKDWFDLKAPIVNMIAVDLPRAAREHYRQIEKDMFTEIDGEGIEAFNAAAKTLKCLQLASGAVYLEDGKTWKDVHDAKIEALGSVVEEAAGAPVLVAYHFKSDLARLQRAFPVARVLDADPRTITDWNAGRIPILLAHPASAGHGLNLQDGGNILVFFSHWWDLEQHDQIIERIGPVRQLQAGHDRPVFIHYIVARGTIDQVVVQRRESKRDVQALLLEYMKAKR